MCLIYRLDFLHPLGQLHPVYVCARILFCKLKPARRMHLPDDPSAECVPHGAPPPFCVSWLAWVNCGRLVLGKRRVNEEGGGSGERGWEVLTIRECLHHDPSRSLHTVLSVVKLWHWSLLFNCRQMFPPSSAMPPSLLFSYTHVEPWCSQNSSGNLWDAVPAVVLVT